MWMLHFLSLTWFYSSWVWLTPLMEQSWLKKCESTQGWINKTLQHVQRVTTDGECDSARGAWAHWETGPYSGAEQGEESNEQRREEGRMQSRSVIFHLSVTEFRWLTAVGKWTNCKSIYFVYAATEKKWCYISEKKWSHVSPTLRGCSEVACCCSTQETGWTVAPSPCQNQLLLCCF